MKVLGLAGFPGSGKDTLARVLMEKYTSFRRVAFADPMREAALALDPIVGGGFGGRKNPDSPEVEFYPTRVSDLVKQCGWEGAKKSPEVRRTLQRLGTEMGRGVFGPNFWVNLGQSRMRDLFDSGFDVVVTDVRFPNEAGIIRHFGGRVVWISRDGVVGSDHASDTALKESDCDLSYRNNLDLSSPEVVDGIDLEERKEFLADILMGMVE